MAQCQRRNSRPFTTSSFLTVIAMRYDQLLFSLLLIKLRNVLKCSLLRNLFSNFSVRNKFNHLSKLAMNDRREKGTFLFSAMQR